MTYHLPAMINLIAAVRSGAGLRAEHVKVMVGGRLFHAESRLWQRVGADGHAADADEACRLADRLMDQDIDREPSNEQRRSEMSREVGPPPPLMPDDIYDELGRVYSEVVVLNRELARKNAEVERLNAEVSRHARHLEEADLHKNDFLAMLGHELRGPLAPLSNALALLGLGDPDRETVRWVRDIMERQVRQMVRLVDDLLDLSRIMQGKLQLCKERVEMAALIAPAVETARPIIDAKGHELIVSVPVGPVVLFADPMRLSQVLTNLLNNAAKYSEPGGKIVVSARTDGNKVVIGVRDDGVGIAPEMLPRIFDLFMQDGRSANLSQGGFGVGVALVKSLVEMHGSVIQARSDGPNRGSEFLVRLPLPALAVES